MRYISFVFLAVLTMTAPATSLERAGKPHLVLLGESRLSVFFWDIYDARLYVQGKTYDPDKPFALSLTYLRDFSGSDIAERSIEEIRQQGFGQILVVEFPRWSVQQYQNRRSHGDTSMIEQTVYPGRRFYLGRTNVRRKYPKKIHSDGFHLGEPNVVYLHALMRLQELS